jgi:ribosomal protein L22
MQMKISANREGMSISLKHTHEIMEAIVDKNINRAVDYLNKVIEKKEFVPFRHYPSKGHKAGVPAGYPVKATKSVISILKELKSNAKNLGGDMDNVTISGYALGRGGYPRFRGGGVYKHGKRTNLRIFGTFEQVEKPKTEEVKPAEATEQAPQALEAGVNATKENN